MLIFSNKSTFRFSYVPTRVAHNRAPAIKDGNANRKGKVCGGLVRVGGQVLLEFRGGVDAGGGQWEGKGWWVKRKVLLAVGGQVGRCWWKTKRGSGRRFGLFAVGCCCRLLSAEGGEYGEK